MKNTLITLALAGSLLCAHTGFARQWTNATGGTMEAELLSVEGETAILDANGREMRIPLSRLSDDDQAYVAEWQASNKGKTDAQPAAQDIVGPQFNGYLGTFKDGTWTDYQIPQDDPPKYYVLYFTKNPVRTNDEKEVIGTDDTFTPKLQEFYAQATKKSGETGADATAAASEDAKPRFELISIPSAGQKHEYEGWIKETGAAFPMVKMGRRANIDFARNYSSEKEPFLVILTPQGQEVMKSGSGQSIEDVLTKMRQVLL